MTSIIVPAELLKQPIKNTDLRVLLAMAAEAPGGVCYRLQADLAAASGVSVNTIARCLRRLAKHGLIDPLGYNPDTRTHGYLITSMIGGVQ